MTLDVKLCNNEGVCVYVRSDTLDVKLCNNEGVCVCVCQERDIELEQGDDYILDLRSKLVSLFLFSLCLSLIPLALYHSSMTLTACACFKTNYC